MGINNPFIQKLEGLKVVRVEGVLPLSSSDSVVVLRVASPARNFFVGENDGQNMRKRGGEEGKRRCEKSVQ